MYDQIIFDGFPRTVEQYRFLRDWLKDKHVGIDLVFVIEIGDEESVKRLSARRLDPDTGVIYNLITNPPPAGVDQGKLVQRDDDVPEAIIKRLATYRSKTKVLIDELKRENIKVIEVDGERNIEAIQEDLVREIDAYKK
jgi:adenylate kinase